MKVVPGEGMPLPEDTKRRGDLIIEFDVEFPQRLSREQKILVTQALTSTGPAFQRPAARAPAAGRRSGERRLSNFDSCFTS